MARAPRARFDALAASDTATASIDRPTATTRISQTGIRRTPSARRRFQYRNAGTPARMMASPAAALSGCVTSVLTEM